MAENIKTIQKEISIQTVKMNKAIDKLAEKFDKLTTSFEMIAENTVLKEYQNPIFDFDEIRRLPHTEEKMDMPQVEKLNVEEYFYELVQQCKKSWSKTCKSIEESIQQLIQNLMKSFPSMVKTIRDSASSICSLIKNEMSKLVAGISELFINTKRFFNWESNLKDSLTCNCTGNTQKNETEKTNPLAEIGKWIMSNILEELVTDKVKELLEPMLGTKPITTTILAGVQALFGNKAAQSALVFMSDPLLKMFSPFLKSVAPLFKVALPVLASVAALKFGFDLGKEKEELLENVENLGEEGRVASGNSVMDKTALHQYDMENANMSIQQIYAEWLSSIIDNIKIAMRGSLFSDIFRLLSQVNWEELGNNIKTGLATKWEEFTTWWEDTGIYNWWTEEVSPWFAAEKWQELGTNFKDGLTIKWEEFTTWWKDTGIYNWWTEEVSPWFTAEKWQELGTNFKDGLTTKWEEFTTWWKDTGVYNWWMEDVVPWFTIEKWKSLADGILKGVSNKWNEVISWWEEKTELSKIDTTIENICSEVENAWQEVKDWWRKNASLSEVSAKIKIPYIDITWKTEGWEAEALQKLGLKGLPDFSVTYLATGGFPEDGWFRASHGEIMGRFDNGQSVVANNMQITKGIANAVYPAVYDAMMSALSQNGRGGDVVVQIDGREVFKTVRKQANNYTRQTGQPAFNY